MKTKQTSARKIVQLGSARTNTQAVGPGSKTEPNLILRYE